MEGRRLVGRDARREKISQKGVFVSNEGKRLCEFRLRVGVMLEGLRRGGSHGDLLGGMRRGLLLDGAKEVTHRCYIS